MQINISINPPFAVKNHTGTHAVELHSHISVLQLSDQAPIRQAHIVTANPDKNSMEQPEHTDSM